MIRISHQQIGARFKTSIRSFLRNNYINMIIVCIYVSFLSFWEGLFEAYACPLTGSLVCNAVTEIIWAVLLCCIGRKCWTEFKCGVLIGDKKLFASITVIGLWIWYRFKSDSFVLYALPDIPFFRYVDVMLVIGLSIIIQRFFSNKHVFPLEGDGFLTDNPIDNIDDDVLNRKEDAKAAIYKILLTPTVESAFTFGVVAPWGEGKTSFLNMMKHHISSLGTQSITIMDFNPWLYDNDANLTKSFFTELQSTLSPYNASIVKNINAYMKVLSIAEDKLQTIQNMFTTSAMDVVSTNLRTEMSRLDRKVVVFVDDIDRLNKDEILQVFKLVRNTSNFPNMYFILAYDHQYIIDSLGKQFAIQALHFTEKIMQEEFELMPATTDQLREELLRLFSAFLNDNEQKAIQS